MLQVLRAILDDRKDTETKVYVISANKAEQDILCREELESLVLKHGSRLSSYYVLSSTETLTPEWTQGRGRINEEMLRRYLPPPPCQSFQDGENHDEVDESKMILSCGPPGMIESLKNELGRIGWDLQRDLVVF